MLLRPISASVVLEVSRDVVSEWTHPASLGVGRKNVWQDTRTPRLGRAAVCWSVFTSNFGLAGAIDTARDVYSFNVTAHVQEKFGLALGFIMGCAGCSKP